MPQLDVVLQHVLNVLTNGATVGQWGRQRVTTIAFPRLEKRLALITDKGEGKGRGSTRGTDHRPHPKAFLSNGGGGQWSEKDRPPQHLTYPQSGGGGGSAQEAPTHSPTDQHQGI